MKSSLWLCYIGFSFVLLGCGGGGSDSANPTPTPPSAPANAAPSVSAGDDVTINEDQTITLTAVASDSDGSIQTVQWSQLSGPVSTLSDPSLLTLDVTPPDIQTETELTFQVQVTDDDNATASDSVTITVIPIEQVTVDVVLGGQTQSQIVEITSGILGDIFVDENSQAVVPTIDQPVLVSAYDAEENVVLMSIIRDIEAEGIQLNGLTTVEALLDLIPEINVLMADQPTRFSSQFAMLDEVQEMADVIENNADWSTENSIFEQQFAQLIDAVFTAINSQPAKNRAIPQENLLSATGGGLSLEGFYIGDAPQFSVGIEPTYRAEDFRTTLELTELSNGFSINIENNYKKKWLVTLMTNDPYGSGNVSIDNRSTQIAASGASTLGEPITFSASAPFSQTGPAGDFYGAYVFGFAAGDLSNAPTSGKAAAAYALSTGYTFLFDFALPIIGKILPDAPGTGCLNWDITSSEAQNLAQSIAGSNEVRSYLIAGDYQGAALEATILLSNNLSSSLQGCLKDATVKELKRISKLLRRLIVYYEAAVIVIDATSIAAEQALGKSVQFFPITNAHNKEVEFLPRDIYEGAPFGSLQYSTEQDLSRYSTSIQSSYQGACIFDEDANDDDNADCEGYVVSGEPPFLVDFVVSCKNVVTNEVVNCSSGNVETWFYDDFDNRLVFTSSDVNDEGQLVFTVEYAEFGEYIGTVETFDEGDGNSRMYTFHVQLKQAQPFLLLEGQLAEDKYNYSQNRLVAVTPIEIDVEGNDPQNITIALENYGFKTAELNDVRILDNNGLSVVSYPSQIGPLNVLDESMSNNKGDVVLRFDPTQNSSASARLIISGNISEESAYYFSQRTYTELEIPIATQDSLLVETNTGVDEETGLPLLWFDQSSIIDINYEQFFSGLSTQLIRLTNQGASPITLEGVTTLTDGFRFYYTPNLTPAYPLNFPKVLLPGESVEYYMDYHNGDDETGLQIGRIRIVTDAGLKEYDMALRIDPLQGTYVGGLNPLPASSTCDTSPEADSAQMMIVLFNRSEDGNLLNNLYRVLELGGGIDFTQESGLYSPNAGPGLDVTDYRLPAEFDRRYRIINGSATPTTFSGDLTYMPLVSPGLPECFWNYSFNLTKDN